MLACNHIYFTRRKPHIFFLIGIYLVQPPAYCSIKPFSRIFLSSKHILWLLFRNYTHTYVLDHKMIWIWQRIRRKTFNDHINFMAKQANLFLFLFVCVCVCLEIEAIGSKLNVGFDFCFFYWFAFGKYILRIWHHLTIASFRRKQTDK